MNNCLTDSLDDALNFIEEMLNDARRDASSQALAMTDVSGHIRRIRNRLGEDQIKKTMVMLALDEVMRDDWREWWKKFGEMERDTFLDLSEKMLMRISSLRRWLAGLK